METVFFQPSTAWAPMARAGDYQARQLALHKAEPGDVSHRECGEV